MQNQPFSGACGAFGAGGTGGTPCLGIPSRPRAGGISFLAFHRRLLGPTVPVLGNTSRSERWGGEEAARRALTPPGSVLVSPGEIQTRTRELRQLPPVPSPPQQGWTRRPQCSRGPTAIAAAAADKSLLAIKTVTCCKQQKLTTITKNYQRTESLFPS